VLAREDRVASAARVSLITAEELLERPDDDYKYELDGARRVSKNLRDTTLEDLVRDPS
jgi:hypothetical protein